MKKFVQRAIQTFPKLDDERRISLVKDLVADNELLDMVLSSLPMGILVADMKHELVFVTRAAKRFLALRERKEGGQVPFWRRVGLPLIAKRVKWVLEHQERMQAEEFVVEDRNKETVLSCNLFPLVKEGRIQGNLFCIEDVTEKRLQETRVKRLERLASLTTIAAGMAHEIKNPLGSLGIHIQLVEKVLLKKPDPCREGISQHLKVISEEIERLNNIVVNFLFTVRPLSLNLKEQSLNALVEEVVDLIHVELEESDITLQLTLTEDLPPLALAQNYIKQVLLNIIKNALTAMEGRKEKTLAICSQLREDEVILSISDTGEGISPKWEGKIFEPYFTTTPEGSGLGLTLVYRIVKEHKGEIKVNSREGKGTTFTITFPLSQRGQRLLGWKENNAL